MPSPGIKDGASSRVGKQRGIAVMLKSSYPAEALCVQDILKICCRSDAGEKDTLNLGRGNAELILWRSTVLQNPGRNLHTRRVNKENKAHFTVRTT